MERSAVDLAEWSRCPDCGAADSVRVGVCDVCLGDMGERRDPSTAPPSLPLRFSDVLDELRTVVDLAGAAEEGGSVAAAGRRAERLLDALREQFVRDLGAPVVGPAGAPAD